MSCNFGSRALSRIRFAAFFRAMTTYMGIINYTIFSPPPLHVAMQISPHPPVAQAFSACEWARERVTCASVFQVPQTLRRVWTTMTFVGQLKTIGNNGLHFELQFWTVVSFISTVNFEFFTINDHSNQNCLKSPLEIMQSKFNKNWHSKLQIIIKHCVTIWKQSAYARRSNDIGKSWVIFLADPED